MTEKETLCTDCIYYDKGGIKLYKIKFCNRHKKDEIKIGDKVKIGLLDNDEPYCSICIDMAQMDLAICDSEVLICKNNHRFRSDSDYIWIRIKNGDDFDFE